MEDKIKQFFEENPGAAECYVVLGLVLADKAVAERKLGGIKNQQVKTYTREAGIVYDKTSDELLGELINAEDAENTAQKDYELAPSEDLMIAWKKAAENSKNALHKYNVQLAKENKEQAEKESSEEAGETNAETFQVKVVDEFKTAVSCGDVILNESAAGEVINETPAEEVKAEGPAAGEVINETPAEEVKAEGPAAGEVINETPAEEVVAEEPGKKQKGAGKGK